MSLMIDVDKVERVLIGDEWLDVADNSFSLDSYEYVYANQHQRKSEKFTALHGGGNSGVCASGFIFRTPNGQTVAGPLTAISAVMSTKTLALDWDEPEVTRR